jgi:glycosyltransferase involved in cell wall biosynthesis
VAEALSQWADVTVAFRRTPRAVTPGPSRTIAIEPETPGPADPGDDNAARGLHPLQHLSYCRTLWSFATHQAGAFDIVLEKGWRLSGLLCAAFRRAGVPAILIENDIRYWTEPVDGVHQFGKYLLHGMAHAVAGACSRRAQCVVAETDELKRLLVSRRRVRSERIHVVGLGVDHALFRPITQARARQHLGIRRDATVMLYVGAMDEYHDLAPAIDALSRSSPDVELHVVGGGEYRARYEATAVAAGLACRFHGRVPHASVPTYIAAADVCIAPYNTQAFHGGCLTFSTLKIPEYMACGRPVATVPADGVRKLVTQGVTGFLFPNDESSWRSFLNALPSRERLASMGAAAARAVASLTWTATAARYLELCERVIPTRPDTNGRPVARPVSLARLNQR